MGDLPNPGIQLLSLASPTLAGGFFFLPLGHLGSPSDVIRVAFKNNLYFSKERITSNLSHPWKNVLYLFPHVTLILFPKSLIGINILKVGLSIRTIFVSLLNIQWSWREKTWDLVRFLNSGKVKRGYTHIHTHTEILCILITAFSHMSYTDKVSELFWILSRNKNYYF